MPRILIVEDDPGFAAAAQAYLRRAGFEVEIADDTIAALDRVETCSFDLYLVDVAMPPGKPNGLSFARMMRLQNPKTAIIFLSAHEDMVTLVAELPARAFVKSADLETLVAAIRAELAGETA